MAGKYEEYPEYTDSKIEPLGPIPKAWQVSKFRYAFSLAKGLTITKANLEDSGIPCVNYGEIHSKYGFEISPSTHPLRYVNEKYLRSDSGALLYKGDFAFADTSEDLEGSGNFTQLTSDECLFAGYHTVITRPHVDHNYRFCAYMIESPQFRTQIQLAVKGVKVFSITQAILRNSDIWFPPLPEQIQIARFLDHETGKIDLLIEKQQELITLLKEKRQAVISHAVTKGLNPQAPLKESAIEWLGQVPEHWEVKKFGHISSVVRGASPRPAGDQTLFNGDHTPWVTVAEITKDDEMGLTSTSEFLTRKGSQQSRLFSKGTLIYSNSGATLGVPKIIVIDANANDGVVGFEDLEISREFAYFYLTTLTENIRERVKQGSGQPNLNTEIVKDIRIPVPPDSEIIEIVRQIKNSLKKFSELLGYAEIQIHLLQERRTALISAAVTGKIDVRDWQPV